MNILLRKRYSLKVIRLAYPIMFGMVSHTLMQVIDSAMVGRLGAAALAATGLAGMAVYVVVRTIGAVDIGIQALTSRRFGEKNFQEIGKVMFHAAGYSFGIGLIVSAVLYVSFKYIFVFLTSDPEVQKLGISYGSIRSLEVLAFLIIYSHRGFFNGIGKTKVTMYVMLVVNLLNIILNYIFIFGKFGAPRLEVTGAAIGSAVSVYAGAIMVICWTFLPQYRKKYSFYKRMKFDSGLCLIMARLSYPPSIQNFFVLGGFLTFLKIMASVGTLTLAASNICMTILSTSFMPAVGMGMAASTLVGQNLGAKKKDLAEIYGWEAAKLGTIFMGSLGIVFIIFPHEILRFFTPDMNVINEGVTALRILGFLQFFDAWGIIFSFCLLGAGKTFLVMACEIAIHWLIFIPVTYLSSISLKMGIAGGWGSLGLYIFLFGILMMLLFKKSSWKETVI